MSEISELIAPAPEAPVADTSAADLAAAFSNATPYNPNAQPAPAPVAPVAAPAPVEAANPAPAAPVAVAPEPVAPAVVAPDYAAYLRETFGAETPDALKAQLTLAGQAATFQANQRTAQDVAFEKLLADPAAAAQYVKLQTTDFTTLSDRELHAAAYAHQHSELRPEVAAIRARREFDAEYAAAEFDDADDPAVQEAKVLLADARTNALQTLEGAKAAAREAVLTKAPLADGPTPAQQQAEEARATNWTNGVTELLNAPSLEVEYEVDGKPLKLAFDHKSPSFKEAMLDPNKWVFNQICPDGDASKPNLDRWAVIVALAEQTDVLLKNAMQAGKAQVGAHIPMNTAVNPAPITPSAPASEGSIYDAFRAAAQSRGTNSQY